jgi:hypothetical protein
MMGGNEVNGSFTIQRALDIARNSEGYVDPTIHQYLEHALQDVWARLYQAPDTYLFTKDEFALFNYYRNRFATSEIAQRAVQRFWNNYQGDYSEFQSSSSRSTGEGANAAS